MILDGGLMLLVEMNSSQSKQIIDGVDGKLKGKPRGCLFVFKLLKELHC